MPCCPSPLSLSPARRRFTVAMSGANRPVKGCRLWMGSAAYCLPELHYKPFLGFPRTIVHCYKGRLVVSFRSVSSSCAEQAKRTRTIWI